MWSSILVGSQSVVVVRAVKTLTKAEHSLAAWMADEDDDPAVDAAQLKVLQTNIALAKAKLLAARARSTKAREAASVALKKALRRAAAAKSAAKEVTFSFLVLLLSRHPPLRPYQLCLYARVLS